MKPWMVLLLFEVILYGVVGFLVLVHIVSDKVSSLWDGMNRRRVFRKAIRRRDPRIFGRTYPFDCRQLVMRMQSRTRLAFVAATCDDGSLRTLATGRLSKKTDQLETLNLDQSGRLHGEDGPAIVCRDGASYYCWHGLPVPDDFHSWGIERTLREPNAEIRRAAIERIRWENLTDGLNLVAIAPDPGNPPHELRLYDIPPDLRLAANWEARVLVVQNASLDKGGRRRAFGLLVPARHDDPIEAAADLFGVSRAAYAETVRAA